MKATIALIALLVGCQQVDDMENWQPESAQVEPLTVVTDEGEGCPFDCSANYYERAGVDPAEHLTFCSTADQVLFIPSDEPGECRLDDWGRPYCWYDMDWIEQCKGHCEKIEADGLTIWRCAE
jgi:hypothetical protein